MLLMYFSRIRGPSDVQLAIPGLRFRVARHSFGNTAEKTVLIMQG